MTLSITNAIPQAIASRPAAIVVSELTKRYGNTEAVRGISFQVGVGEIFGLIGPDGAGKTSTFAILAGVMEATQGTVSVLGRPPRDARLGIGYLTQQFSLYLDLSLDENLKYSAGLREVPNDLFLERRERYLRLMGLERFGTRLAGQLSGGMKQKLALCCALVSQPQVLLLDEPTTGVDPVSRREFWDVLAALGEEAVTIVVATPYLDEAERCNRVALMYEGQIQEIGTPAELRHNLGLSRLEVRTTNLNLSETKLLASPSPVIVDVQTFGDRLDVLVKETQAGSVAIHEILKDATIEPADPTLENVFVTRLRQQGSDPAYLPYPYNRPVRSTADIAIGAKDLSRRFGDFQAVKAVTLEVHYGEIYGLLGANGAGKTTTIKMLCGLLEPSAGTIRLAGQSDGLRSSELRKRIGYMSQKFTLYDDLNILENLEFYAGVYGLPRRQRQERIDWVIATCGLVGQEKKMTGSLPGGWKQRVAFGASVMHEPEVLFLDEPTSGVDPLARRQFWRLIEDFARRGTAILVTTHYLEEAEHCNRLGFMAAGEVIAQGTPSQIKLDQPGELLEIIAAAPPAQLAAAIHRELTLNVSTFGDRLHVVLDQPESQRQQLEKVLSGFQPKLRSVPFSLEDAFIGIVQRNSHENP
ncbi:MAG: ABC transporter ATP-binding protein [Anaerolineae bacterium]|nr:ABC transporter ATP-binding protein [Gloeobacterales cyanobacterium ES-bin-313]